MTEATRKPDASRRSQRSREAILTAAMELMAEVGYAKLTIEAIAARAGAGKQTIYRWWPTKSAVVLDAFRLNAETQEDEVDFPDTGDLDADLRIVMRAIADECNNPRYDGPARVMIAEAQHDPEFGAEAREAFLLPAITATKERLRSGQRAGQLRADADLDVVVELLFGPIHHRWLHSTAPITHAYADQIVDYVLAAVRP
ncbi:TetR/AcrR family transcriptional regulator [Stackebrandtia nassauensis]|uniref:Transcriptional regulator, TetR family n=1 Tax=Stackebrandtia nassauensis (strain DSM 44728 / CIP 108903 / NRRL B-16338 / NBRC 102104 / LLR-40K-21) TaxID=446470 RepID=D3PZJ7_STANL|nr:TetR/AcrR family transcriptional regulator [Stackebrandtia nassauensis]ADD41671.1 transcriptional regulator, TetR family [Stackebrandtia nassauensis DSM 44728]